MEIDASAFRPDLASIDALARLRLRFRRARLRGASRELRELVAFCGLEEALRLESARNAEEREESLGVEEEGELGDAIW
jgi:hypothetical protein